MNILITGASGFVARHLVPALLQENHTLILLGRDPVRLKKIYQKEFKFISWQDLNSISPDSVDAVINLAGESIGESRWNSVMKNKIRNSRVSSTQTIVEWCSGAKNKKPHLYNASAIGVYGLQPNDSPKLTESTSIEWDHLKDFLSEVAVAWESAANQANSHQIPLTVLRFGVILKRREGMLKKLELPFSFGAGTVLGNGEQIITWVHINDIVAAILFLLKHPEITGPVNITAPEAVSQKVFAKTLAGVMKRPLFVTMPSWFVKMLFGQMGEELLLGGQRVYPEKLLNAGYKFNFPTLQEALSEEWRK